MATTSVADRYRFSDFTREHYRQLLQLAKRSYVFRSYTDFSRDERFVLWRHDVDLSMQAALALARIEAEEECRATYFLNPHSEFYNVLEREITLCVREIISLGHHIALHLDSQYYGIQSEAELDSVVLREKALLESFFEGPVDAVSFHNPTQFMLSCRRWSYGGLVNAYAEYFQNEVGYCSDSNGYWRHRRLADVLESGEEERLQVLTHDGWWQEAPMSARARVYRCVQGRAEKLMRSYDAILATTPDRANVSDAPDALAHIAEADPAGASFLDELWLRGSHATLFAELWRLLQKHVSLSGVHDAVERLRGGDADAMSADELSWWEEQGQGYTSPLDGIDPSEHDVRMLSQIVARLLRSGRSGPTG